MLYCGGLILFFSRLTPNSRDFQPCATLYSLFFGNALVVLGINLHLHYFVSCKIPSQCMCPNDWYRLKMIKQYVHVCCGPPCLCNSALVVLVRRSMYANTGEEGVITDSPACYWANALTKSKCDPSWIHAFWFVRLFVFTRTNRYIFSEYSSFFL